MLSSLVCLLNKKNSFYVTCFLQAQNIIKRTLNLLYYCYALQTYLQFYYNLLLRQTAILFVLVV